MQIFGEKPEFLMPIEFKVNGSVGSCGFSAAPPSMVVVIVLLGTLIRPKSDYNKINMV